jgi:gp6-like head-tail connector protein
MAAAWPTIDDVKAVLRIDDTADDAYVTTCLAAAIAWTQNRIDPVWVPGSPSYPTPAPTPALEDPLFQVAQAEAARLYRRRDSVDGTIGWGDMGVVRVGPKDPDIETLIAPYLNVVFA